jgi:hypothetical protein
MAFAAISKAVREFDVLWITAGLRCDGDTIAMTAATQPSIEDVLLGHVPWTPKINLHNPFLALANGDDFLRPFLGVLVRRVVVDPVFASGGYHQLRTTLGLHMQRVQSGRGRCRAETKCIVVGHVVRHRDETCLQILGIVEVKELAAGELRDRFCGLGAQRIACGKKGHGSQPKRRSELADAVEHLLAVVPFVLGIGSIPAEAAMRRAWLCAPKPEL